MGYGFFGLQLQIQSESQDQQEHVLPFGGGDFTPPEAIPPVVTEALKSPIRDEGVADRFSKAYQQVLTSAGVSEKDLAKVRFVVSGLRSVSVMEVEKQRYVGIPRDFVLSADTNTALVPLVNEQFPAPKPPAGAAPAQPETLPREILEMQYILRNSKEFPQPTDLPKIPRAPKPRNLPELATALRTGMIPVFSDKGQRDAFSFYLASGFGGPSNGFRAAMDELEEAQTRWPFLEKGKGIFPSVHFADRLDREKLEVQINQFVSKGLEYGNGLNNILQDPESRIGIIADLVGAASAREIVTHLATSPSDSLDRARWLFKTLLPRAEMADLPGAKVRKFLLHMVRGMAFHPPPDLDENAGWYTKAIVLDEVLKRQTEFLLSNGIQMPLPELTKKWKAPDPRDSIADSEVGTLAEKARLASATHYPLDGQKGFFRELGFAEAPFRACLSKNRCKRDDELALHPDYHTFTKEIEGASDGRISFFLGTSGDGTRIALVEDHENVPLSERHEWIEAVRLAVLSKGYLLAVSDADWHNFDTNSTKTEFRPHAGKLGFDKYASNVFRDGTAHIVAPLPGYSSTQFTLYEPNPPYRQKGVDFETLRIATLDLKNGSQANKLEYLRTQKALEQNRHPFEAPDPLLLASWLKSKVVLTALRHEVLAYLFQHDERLGMRELLAVPRANQGEAFSRLWQDRANKFFFRQNAAASLALAEQPREIRDLLSATFTSRGPDPAIWNLLREPRTLARFAKAIGVEADLNPLEQIRLIEANVQEEAFDRYRTGFESTLPEDLGPDLLKWLKLPERGFRPGLDAAARQTYWTRLVERFPDPEIASAAHDKLGLTHETAPGLIAQAIREGQFKAAALAIPHLTNIQEVNPSLGMPVLEYCVLHDECAALLRPLTEAGAGISEDKKTELLAQVKQRTAGRRFLDGKLPRPERRVPKPAAESGENKLEAQANYRSVADALNRLAERSNADLFIQYDELARRTDFVPHKSGVATFSGLVGRSWFRSLLGSTTLKMLGQRNILRHGLVEWGDSTSPDVPKSLQDLLDKTGLSTEGVTVEGVKKFRTESQVYTGLSEGAQKLLDSRSETAAELETLAASAENWPHFTTDKSLAEKIQLNVGHIREIRRDRERIRAFSDRLWGLLNAPPPVIGLAAWVNTQTATGAALGPHPEWAWELEKNYQPGLVLRWIQNPLFFALLTPKSRTEVFGEELHNSMGSQVAMEEFRLKYLTRISGSADLRCSEALKHLVPSPKTSLAISPQDPP